MRTYRHRHNRRGLTLAELLITSTVLVMIGGTASTLAYAVYSAHDACKGQTTAAQHARVAIDRIEKAVAGATASESFPACLVVNFSANSYIFPDSLAVWRPAAAPVDPSGLPRVSELVVFSCDPSLPNRLLEMTWPTNSNVTPAASNTIGWRLLIDSFHSGDGVVKNQLTDRLHAATVDTTPLLENVLTTRRGMVRFARLMAPSESRFTEYRANQRAWNSLDWPLDMYASQTGMRTVNLQVELQIAGGPDEQPDPLPFFGSAVLNYTLRK